MNRKKKTARKSSSADSSYSDADLERIAGAVSIAVPKIRKHRAALEAAAIWFRLDRRAPKRVAPSHLVRKLNAIEKNARRLLLSVGIRAATSAADGPVGEDLAEALTLTSERDSSSLLRTCERLGLLVQLIEGLRAAAELQCRAAEAAEEARAVGKLIVPPGHQGDVAVNDWIAAMMQIYKQVTGRNPGRSVGAPTRRNRGIAGGPLIRFLEATGRPLHIEYTPAAWAERVRLILAQADHGN